MFSKRFLLVERPPCLEYTKKRFCRRKRLCFSGGFAGCKRQTGLSSFPPNRQETSKQTRWFMHLELASESEVQKSSDAQRDARLLKWSRRDFWCHCQSASSTQKFDCQSESCGVCFCGRVFVKINGRKQQRFAPTTTAGQHGGTQNRRPMIGAILLRRDSNGEAWIFMGRTCKWAALSSWTVAQICAATLRANIWFSFYLMMIIQKHKIRACNAAVRRPTRCVGRRTMFQPADNMPMRNRK